MRKAPLHSIRKQPLLPKFLTYAVTEAVSSPK